MRGYLCAGSQAATKAALTLKVRSRFHVTPYLIALRKALEILLNKVVEMWSSSDHIKHSSLSRHRCTCFNSLRNHLLTLSHNRSHRFAFTNHILFLISITRTLFPLPLLRFHIRDRNIHQSSRQHRPALRDVSRRDHCRTRR